MRFREARTISAISVLRHAFPYAASLLSYVVVERVLKRYLVDHWRDQQLATRRLPDQAKLKGHRGKCLKELRSLNKARRMKEVVSRLTLGDVEALLRRPSAHQSAKDRNEAIHSNLYLREEARLSRAKQQAKNEARFANAKRHLARAMRRYAGYKLVDVDGVLMAQPNKRMDAAERVRLKGR